MKRIKIESHVPPPRTKVITINDGLRKENKKLKRLLKHALSLIPRGVRDDKFFQEVDPYLTEE